MSDLTCDVCFSNYKAGQCNPRSLRCGHSCCTACLKKIVETSKACMICRKKIDNRKPEDYPINFSLLASKGTLEQMSIQERNLGKCFEDFFVKVFHIADEEVDCVLKVQQLQNLLKNEEIDQMYPYEQNKFNIWIKLDVIQDENKFLKEICNYLQMDDLFAVTKVNNKRKLAKLSASNDRIFIHSFDEQNENVSHGIQVVLLSDLKKAGRKNRIKAFITVPKIASKTTQTLLINLQDSYRVPEFIKLCTGEVGPSLKGTNYTHGTPKLFVKFKDGILQHLPYKSVFKIETKQTNQDYVIEEERKLLLFEDCIACIFDSNGEFQVLGIASSCNLANVVGIIQEDRSDFNQNLYSNIKYGEGSLIEDCGLVIELKQNSCSNQC